MKKLASVIKKTVASAALAFGLLGSQSAHAGIPVIDVAAVLEAVLQTMSWVNQAEQMLQTIQQAESQIRGIESTVQSLANARNLGSILNNPLIQSMMPNEIRDANSLLLSVAHSPDRLGAINSALTAYGVQTEYNGVSLQGIRNTADSLTRMQQMLQSSQHRRQQVDQLASRVDSAADAKDSMDLVSRNVIESTRVTNDMMQAMVSIEAGKAADRLREIAEGQQRMSSLRQRFLASAQAQGHMARD